MLRLNENRDRFHAAIDANGMRVRFQQQLKKILGSIVELEEFHIARAFPRGLDAFSIQYQMLLRESENGPAKRLILFGHLLGPSENWPKYLIRHKHQTIVFKDLRMVVPVFPFDPELPVIAELCNLSKATEIIENVLEAMTDENSRFRVIDYEVMGYRLERRCVLKYILDKANNGKSKSDQLHIIAKIARPKRAKTALRSMKYLRENGFGEEAPDHLRLPKIYYADVDKGVYMMESVPGTPLHAMTGALTLGDACVSVAELLKKLHRLVPGDFGDYSHGHELENLGKRVEMATKLYPNMTAMFESTYRTIELCASRVIRTYQKKCIHRDFYDKQVLFSKHRTTLIDCDNLALGDPAQDYGNFIAHLKLRQLQEPDNAENIENGIVSFRNTYEAPDDNFKERASWWEAASLLRLAILYSLRPRWHKISVKLVHRSLMSLPGNQTFLEEVDEKSKT